MELNPYFPTVNAIAPNAPKGATFIKIDTTLNIGAVASRRSSVIGCALSPTEANATPNNTEINKTCRILPSTNGLNTVVGMMFIKKAVSVLSCAFATYSDTFSEVNDAGSIFNPAPGSIILATTIPITSANVEKVTKYSIAFPATRPTAFMSFIPAIPVTTVRKITGAMIILTSLINASPNGFKPAPKSGKKFPNKIPIIIAIMTCTYKL